MTDWTKPESYTDKARCEAFIRELGPAMNRRCVIVPRIPHSSSFGDVQSSQPPTVRAEYGDRRWGKTHYLRMMGLDLSRDAGGGSWAMIDGKWTKL